ncbi:hypothetical protein AN958_08266 [Leucoagaricus sp. SymC.cos]|nr:hypothetical protein AN958_08266 [Leucoagaricus sp. SymC.cos]
MSKHPELANFVVNSAQKDDMVILVWSYCYDCIHVFDNLGEMERFSLDRFNLRLLEHPKSGKRLLLVETPRVYAEAKSSFEDIKSRLHSKGAEVLAHIWCDDIDLRGMFRGPVDKPLNWERILEEADGIDQICLLLTDWEFYKSEECIEYELKTRYAMKDEIAGGMLIERLTVKDPAALWSVLEKVIELGKVGSDGIGGKIQKRIERNGIQCEEIWDKGIQRDIDALYSRLDESAKGKKVRQEMRRYLAERQTRIMSLLAVIDDEHEIGRKKKEAQETLDYEYLIFRKTMWSFFEAIEKLAFNAIMLSARAVQLNIDGHYYPTKTPARSTKNRGENAYQGAMTIQNGKGKVNLMRTPFQPKTAQPQRLLKDVPGSTSKGLVPLITRPSKPLTDKTPFANRILDTYKTPASDQKSFKLNVVNSVINEQLGATPESGPGSARASSTRKHARVPKANANFQTPANQGNHWDISDGDIVVPEMEQVLEIEEEFDDSEEIEYMPPNALDLPYHPPFDFDLPDYKLLGQAALRNVFGYPADELSPPSFDFQFSDLDLMKWDSLSLPSLGSDDDSSSSKTAKPATTKRSTNPSKPTTTTRATSALASNTRITSRPTTSASVRRPATSASVKAPTTKLVATQTAVATKRTAVTSTTTTHPTSTALRPTSSIIRAAEPTSKTIRTTKTQPLTSANPTSANPTRLSTTKLSAGATAKTITPRPAATRPPVSRPTASRPTLPNTRSTTSAPVRSAPSRAGAVKPFSVSSVARATSGHSRKPPVPRVGRLTTTSQTKSALTSANKLYSANLPRKISRSKSTQPDVVESKPGYAASPSPNNVAGAESIDSIPAKSFDNEPKLKVEEKLSEFEPERPFSPGEAVKAHNANKNFLAEVTGTDNQPQIQCGETTVIGEFPHTHASNLLVVSGGGLVDVDVVVEAVVAPGENEKALGFRSCEDC